MYVAYVTNGVTSDTTQPVDLEAKPVFLRITASDLVFSVN